MAIGCRVCRVCAVQAGSQPRSCRPRQGGWGPLPEPPTDPALTSRSDMGVLSSSGRCCSSARTMQFAMMVAKIMYSKGVRPSQGKPSWAEPAGAWGPPQTRLVGETEAGEGPVGCPKGRGVWDPPRAGGGWRQRRGPGCHQRPRAPRLINFPIKGATRRPRLLGTKPLARREPAAIKAPRQQRDPGRPTRHPPGPTGSQARMPSSCGAAAGRHTHFGVCVR